MKIFKKCEFESLMEDFPEGGIVFAEYEPDIDVLQSPLMVTDGDFGAREVVPHDGEVFVVYVCSAVLVVDWHAVW